MSDIGAKPPRQYLQRGRKMVLVRVPEDIRDRLQYLAARKGHTIGFEIEQLLKEPLASAEKTAAN